MSAQMKARLDRSAVDLIRFSAPKLIDDTRIRLVIPLLPATATIAEVLASKGAR